MNHWNLRQPLFALILSAAASLSAADALERYVQAPDASYNWKVEYRKNEGEHSATHLKLTSQTWRTNVWTHDVHVIRPAKMRHPEIAFLFITGSGNGTRYAEMLA